MKRAVVDPENCINCETCLVEINCPNHAIIREDPSDKPWIDFYKCRGCMKCTSYCNGNAVNEISRPCDGNARMGW